MPKYVCANNDSCGYQVADIHELPPMNPYRLAEFLSKWRAEDPEEGLIFLMEQGFLVDAEWPCPGTRGCAPVGPSMICPYCGGDTNEVEG